MNAPARPVLAFAPIPIEFNWRRLSGYVCTHTHVYAHIDGSRAKNERLVVADLAVCRAHRPPSSIFYFSLLFLSSSFFSFLVWEGTRTLNRQDGYGRGHSYFRWSLNERCQHAKFLDLVTGLSIIQHWNSLTLLISWELQRSASWSCLSLCWFRIFSVVSLLVAEVELSLAELYLPNCIISSKIYR